ncbi:MAG: efflux RND transporter periplasmic adaptor subunit [Bacteroidales bacterium]|nr:efflux RND transporter periplasmic adaptor subunit [Bacteroidales bacterium]
MKYYFYCLAVMLTVVCLTSCKTSEEDNREEMARRSSVRDAVAVSTVELKKSTFYHELVSNGKVYAKRTATVPFRVDGTIEKIYVQNGDRVNKGDLLAELEDFNYRIQYEKAQQQLEKASIEFKDDLITFHGSEDTIDLSPDMLRMSKIRSGLIDAETNLREAEYQLKHTKIYAPIAGTVADLEAKEWNPANIYTDGLCKIIDNSVIEVEFPVLESEYGFIEKGMPVNIIPFISDGTEYTGHITKINPMVDENGMVKVRAELRNGGKLLEGMNVKILIRKPVEDRLVVPKEALVIRQGRDVVFVREDSLAIWKYVTTEFENSDSFSVSEGLEEGDLVIHRGNVNLAHETVVVEEEK